MWRHSRYPQSVKKVALGVAGEAQGIQLLAQANRTPSGHLGSLCGHDPAYGRFSLLSRDSGAQVPVGTWAACLATILLMAVFHYCPVTVVPRVLSHCFSNCLHARGCLHIQDCQWALGQLVFHDSAYGHFSLLSHDSGAKSLQSLRHISGSGFHAKQPRHSKYATLYLPLSMMWLYLMRNFQIPKRLRFVKELHKLTNA
ncbi:hypothetical protein GOP47_0023034 [Adiantum capillus-veneris]|uniref:Uncharacterized protein n=1 Tax=Adiantum capillus-veneris TaxID=13818 RepID=A0A9D4U6Y9_ADICA|nr:hypothetical protein GOP47_0023034 [Adiantum capillus-veneris]